MMNNAKTHEFSKLPRTNIQRSVFNRSHSLKTTFDAGYLVPIFCDEVVPGDSFTLDMNNFCRLTSPLSVPVMDNMYLETFWFYVPMRLVWENWDKFCGAQDNPNDSTDYLMPSFTNIPPSAVTPQSIFDYFGIPFLTERVTIKEVPISCLPFRAYNLIWNEWFRDQNLQDSVPFGKTDVNDNYASYTLLRRGKRHDYFTSCLPYPQRGPAAEISIGGLAPILPYHVPTSLNDVGLSSYNEMVASASGTLPAIGYMKTSSTAERDNMFMNDLNLPASEAGAIMNNQAGNEADGGNRKDTTKFLFADLSAATPVSINDFRMAFQVQRMYERDARSGCRSRELILAHFGTDVPDYRLYRPEYLGGTSQPIIINPVAQTSGSVDGSTPQANLSAFGVTGGRDHVFSKSFVEFGYIIGLANVRADLTYQQGLNRMWSRRTRFDFYWPSFAHLGEQAVYNKEIYLTNDASANEVFGYQERYAEYRYSPNRITGKMRSGIEGGSLDIWHLAQHFGNQPVLNAEFIQDNPPVKRVTAVPSEPDFLADFFFHLKCARPMPLYGVPGLVDHF